MLVPRLNKFSFFFIKNGTVDFPYIWISFPSTFTPFSFHWNRYNFVCTRNKNLMILLVLHRINDAMYVKHMFAHRSNRSNNKANKCEYNGERQRKMHQKRLDRVCSLTGWLARCVGKHLDVNALAQLILWEETNTSTGNVPVLVLLV